MNRRDKLKVITEVNNKLEQSYLKTKGFLKDNLINEDWKDFFGKKNEPSGEPNEKFGTYFFVPNTDNLNNFESWLLKISPKIDGQPLLGPYQEKNILEFINSGKITNQSYIRKLWNEGYNSLNKWGFPEDFPEFKSTISKSKYNSYQQDVDKNTMLKDFITRFNDFNKIRQKEYNRSETDKKPKNVNNIYYGNYYDDPMGLGFPHHHGESNDTFYDNDDDLS